MNTKTLPSYTKIKKTANKYTWEVYHYSKTGLPQDNLPHKFLNVERKIIKLQTNSLKFEGGSWLEFPSAKEVKIENYLYNEEDLILTIKLTFNLTDPLIMGYHLRLIK